VNLNFLKSVPLPKMVKDILTDDAGNYVPDKVLLVLIGLAFVSYQGWDLLGLKHAFDAVKFCGGGGLLLGGGGAGSFAMSRMRPNSPAEPDQ
jgi:hypothetical protein